MPDTLHYLKNKEIDFAQWDQCLQQADNGIIYGFSFYLNAMCPGWDAIVLNDYEAVFPMPWRKKYGIYYLYQPFLTAQLGLFGKNINADLLEHFLDKIPGKFRYWDISLNHNNNFNLRDYSLFPRTNLVLDLSKTYFQLHAGYKQTTKRNLKKSINHLSAVTKEVAVEDVVYLSKKQDWVKNGNISKNDY
jgi:hypothetical protein